jgi:hypothetical protein
MTRRSRCYAVTLPDGRTVRLQAQRMPTRRVAEAVAALVDAAHKRMRDEEREPEPEGPEAA